MQRKMEELKLLNRRDFLRRSVLGGGALAAFTLLPENVLAALSEDYIKLTVLHTNDVHSHIEPFPENHPKYAGQGGAARRSALIKKIRSEEKNVLLFDAGDFWQGTPYFNLYGGELELKLMTQMGYDAAAIGNHDFDNGVDGLAKQVHHAGFPFVCCNYDFSDTSMNGKTVPYKVFEKEGLKIGVFGLGIQLDGLVDKRMYGKTVYHDPAARSAKYAHLLKKEMNCDLVICLSHLGDSYREKKISDVALAKQSKNIDLIIGGHTHRFIDVPLELANSDGEKVLVAQAGWAGLRMGKIDYFFSRKKKKKFRLSSMVKIFDK